jgi:hypothetical protein
VNTTAQPSSEEPASCQTLNAKCPSMSISAGD